MQNVDSDANLHVAMQKREKDAVIEAFIRVHPRALGM